MAVLEILKYPASALRRKCLPVERVTERIEELARAMLDTLHDAPGVGLAAPQVGENVRLIVVDVSLGKDPGRCIFSSILKSKAPMASESWRRAASRCPA